MTRTFETHYRQLLLTYSRRVGWLVFLLNIQGLIVAFGIVTLPFTALIWTQARNLNTSGMYARELAEAEELPSKDKIIAVLVTGYEYVGKFLWWYGFWFVFIVCGVFCSRWLLPWSYDNQSLLSAISRSLLSGFENLVDKTSRFF